MSTLLVNVPGSTAVGKENLLGVGKSEDGVLVNTDFEPRLKPSNKFIDVVNNFSWYAGPKSSVAALNKVPRIFLNERRQVLNSAVSSALYYLNVISKNSADIVGEQNVERLKSLLQVINSNTPAFIKSFTDGLDKFKSAGDKSLLTANNLQSLIGIYFTELTGFNYVFPYYDKMPNVSNSWGSDGGGQAAELIQKGLEMVDEVSKLTNIAQPGVYIQKPKYFSFADEGKSVSVNFPLLNTIQRSDKLSYQQNYELLWLLAFQNKPYKTSFARTVPPKIYTLSIPGVFSTPYSYISELSIDFLGTVRRLKVDIPSVKGESVSSSSVTVPIPEAYNVSITFTSLINDFGNQMVGTGFATSVDGNKVSVGAG